MRYVVAVFLVCMSVLSVAPAYADGNDCGDGQQQTQLMRDDLVTLKGHMQAIIGALGEAPAPYATEQEHWTLPSYVCRDKHGYFLIDVSYDASLTTAALQKKMQDEYQRKFMAAQARGDFQAMGAITQEMQTKLTQQAMATQADTPVEIHVYANDSASQTIDPDSVLRDGRGFIALKAQQGGASEGQERVTFYFDKVDLKDAHTMASFSLGGNDHRVPDKLALINAKIDISGPAAVVEKIAKQVKAQAVLNELSEKRTKVSD